ncbi:tRNA dihydrouridine synthase DusB [Bernardetia sp.]|uniref:tRNA dihydrouridine synthase DusB n=1 Tax=Bernardetia sp. TaxID=1937974 RepID=UPI0025B8E2D7|nr:tRNA dihydrouridine synthase DusB [Bernardetia sp.]
MVKIGNVELGEFPLLLAPMEDVSDPPFRAVCKECGADMMYTEFISVEGLIRDADKSVEKLDIFDYERPVGIQIFGAELDSMLKATEIVEKENPEVLDINFGCPVKKVVCKGAGAGILKDIPKMELLTKEIVNKTNLPVTVKTRLGWDYDSIQILEVAKRLQGVGIQALSIHGRTRKQMYTGEADWSYIAEVKNSQDIHIPIFGNGDIDSPQKALEYKNRFGVDGIMIGRAAIGYPWIFREIKHYLKTGELLPPPTLKERLDICRKHFMFSLEWKKSEIVAINEMKRHYAAYFKGLKGIKQFRMRLVQSSSSTEVFDILNEIEEQYAGVEFTHAY